jgi:hypothetical protein
MACVSRGEAGSANAVWLLNEAEELKVTALL